MDLLNHFISFAKPTKNKLVLLFLDNQGTHITINFVVEQKWYCYSLQHTRHIRCNYKIFFGLFLFAYHTEGFDYEQKAKNNSKQKNLILSVILRKQLTYDGFTHQLPQSLTIYFKLIQLSIKLLLYLEVTSTVNYNKSISCYCLSRFITK